MGEADKRLQKKRVVITRAVEQSESMVEALKRNGAIPVLLPMIAFAPPDDASSLDDALRNLRSFNWVFLTSQNALRAMQDRCALIGIPIVAAIAGVKIAAVGPATAEAVQMAGLEVAYIAKKHQGVALAEELSASVKGQKVLLPRSDRASRDLVEALNRCEANVTEVVAYKTMRPSEDENKKYLSEIEQGTDAVLFFSPSAVHHLQDLLGAARFVILSNKVAYVAIGPVTEKALRETGVQRVISSTDVQAGEVIEALVEFFSGASLPAGAKHG